MIFYFPTRPFFTNIFLLVPYCLFGSLLPAVSLSLNDCGSQDCVIVAPSSAMTKLKIAGEFFDAGLFQQAATAYQEILGEVTQQYATTTDEEQKGVLLEVIMQTRFYLAQVYFSLEQYDATLSLLAENMAIASPLSRQLQELKVEAFYMMALAYKSTHQYALAIEALQETANKDEARFEMGVVYYLWDKYPEAKQQLLTVDHKTSMPQLYVLAQIYISRIYLAQGSYKEAASSLEKLHALLPINDRLHFELYYLQGEVYFHMHDYIKAIGFFEKSLPERMPQKSPWYGDTLYYLGWCYLKIGDDPLKNATAQAADFTKAEDAFQKLIALRGEERAYLALSQCYLSCAKRLHNDEAYARAEILLSQQDIFKTREAQTHALLLRAEATSSYAVRDKFYRQLTLETNSDTSFYAKGWYLRALNDYENALSLVATAQNEKALNAFERSAAGFAKAFILLKEKDPGQAGMALKYRALAISYHNSQSTDLQAFLLMDELMQTYPDLWYAMESPDEIIYLHGFFASRLFDDEKYATTAEKSLKAAAQYPQGNFGDIALRHLGAMLYRKGDFAAAEAVYLQLVDSYPSSLLAGEAWFWAACCGDNLHKDAALTKERRRHVFENFPLSPYAAEAFFTFYTYQEYLQGERSAVKHLQTFTEKYRSSPYLLEAFYLIGLDYKRDRKTPDGKWLRKRNLTEAIDAFQEVEAQFDLLAEKKTYSSRQI